MMRRHLAVHALALSLLALSGCEVEGGGDEFTTAYDGYLNKCANCHAADAPGKTAGTETSLDFTSETTARQSISSGKAAGLTGNAADCNGVPFVVSGKPEQSLLIAVIDADARKTFDLPSHPNCDNDAITDMALKVGGSPDAATLEALKTWITNGAL